MSVDPAGEASPEDVQEQRAAVDPDAPAAPVTADVEADPADVVEQAAAVPEGAAEDEQR